MKKIYLPLLCVVLQLFAFSPVKSQTACPGAIQNVNFSNGVCAIVGVKLVPNENVALFDVDANLIGQGTTNANGDVTIPYNCGVTVNRATICYLNNGVPTCCDYEAPVPLLLPVKISFFNAEIRENNAVVLNWTSELELGSHKYIVQRSDDGKTFTDIGELKAAGNSVKAVNYNFTDFTFNGGISYFRLKEVDKDGEFDYSKIVYVNNRKEMKLVKAVAPNPFVSDIQLIGINTADVTNKNIKVYSSFGQMIPFRITGANSIAIDPSAPRGVYLLKVKEQIIKLVKN
jgi:hypothetical protein